MRTPLLVLTLASAWMPAQDAPTGAPPRDVVQAADPVSGTWGVDFASAYFLRGFVQEKQGAIAQPHLELAYDLGALGSADQRVTTTLGVWNSLHDDDTGSGGTNQSMWYESDFYAGVHADLLPWLDAGAVYTSYYGPNGRFRSVQEVAFSLTLDDRDWLALGDRGLQPTLLVAFELDGQLDAGNHPGTFAQLGIEPQLRVATVGDAAIDLALPAHIGWSLGDYYEDNFGRDHRLGFVDIGAELTAQLTFLPARAGRWEASFGLHLLFLGDTGEERNGGDGFELVSSLGLSTRF